jgi:CBS domain-containing protein
MTRDCPSVEGRLKVQDFVDQELLRTGQRCFMVVDNGDVSGLVTPHEVKKIARASWPSTALRDIMRPLGELRAVKPNAPLYDALELMSRYDLNQLPVVSNHHLEGVVSRSHLLSYLQMHSELQA